MRTKTRPKNMDQSHANQSLKELIGITRKLLIIEKELKETLLEGK